MKKNILTLIIGILIGSIITTAVFLILKDNTSGKENRMNRGEKPFMDSGFQNRENEFSIPEANSAQDIENLNNIEE